MIGINCDPISYPEGALVKGFYFKPDCCQAKHYLIEIETIQPSSNAIAKIHEVGIPQNENGEFHIDNGAECSSFYYVETAKVDVWAKYYFPEIVENQMYHDYDGKNDEMLALAQAISFAVSKCLEVASISML